MSALGFMAMTSPGADTSRSPVLGAYQWEDRTWRESPAEFARSLDQLHAAGVTDLYVDVTRAVTYHRDDQSAVGPYLQSLSRVVTDGADREIRVHALFGDPAWATTDLLAPLEALGVVRRFEDSHGSRLAGVQFDVEPWGLPTWPGNEAVYAENYVTFVDAVAARFQSLALGGELGFAVPYWFAGTTAAIPHGTAPLGPIVESLGVVADPYLVVMAYRDHAEGVDGSIALMSAALDQTDASVVRVLVGQEVGDVTPAHLTYFGRPWADVDHALAVVRQSLADSPSFRGIAIDDAASLLAIRTES